MPFNALCRLCVCICMYFVFILSTISPGTTGLQAQYDPSNCPSTVQLWNDWHSSNWKTEAQGWSFIHVLEVFKLATGDRTAILSGHPSHSVPLPAFTWDWTHVLCVPRRVCQPLVADKPHAMRWIQTCQLSHEMQKLSNTQSLSIRDGSVSKMCISGDPRPTNPSLLSMVSTWTVLSGKYDKTLVTHLCDMWITSNSYK